MPRNRTFSRFLTIAISMVALLVGLAVSSFVRLNGVSSAVGGQVAPKAQIEWQADAGHVRWLSFACSGQYFITVDTNGLVALYSATGARRYSAEFPGVNRAVVSSDGRYAALYSYLNTTNPQLIFLDAQGRVYWKLRVAGAVWCADGFGRGEMGRFVVGTGERYVYVVDLGKHRKRYRRWKAPGAVVSCRMDAGGDQVIFGSWQRASIGRSDIDGTRDWLHDADPSNLHYVEPLHAADRMLVTSIPNRAGGEGKYALLDDRGELVTSGAISSRERTRVLAAPSGRFLCLGSDRLLRHRGKTTVEKHALLLDSKGKMLCDKGSLFFPADPVLVTSTGYVLVTNGKGALFTMSPAGDLRPSLKLSAPIVRSVSSRDGSRVLLQCGDGRLYLLRVR